LRQAVKSANKRRVEFRKAVSRAARTR
jgi:hypothetical protein